jgi:uncharacterized protein YjdB
MKTWKCVLRALSPAAFAVIVGFVFTGCTDGNEETKDVAVTGVTLNENSLELEVGGEAELTATVLPKGATDKTVTWVSSAPAVVSVTPDATNSRKAKVKALAERTEPVTITVTTVGKKADGKPETETCEVTVKAASGGGDPVTGVSLDEEDLELEVGAEEELTATVEPSTANQTVTWLSSAPTVVSVTPDGTDSRKAKVKALAEGTGPVTITVTTVGKKADGTSATKTCTVTVKPESGSDDPVTGVSLDEEDLELEVGDEAELTATVEPSTADQTVTWLSSAPTEVSVTPDATDSRIATVKALIEGAEPVTITVTTVGKKADGTSATKTCTVTVVPEPVSNVPVTNVTLDKSTLTLTVGGTGTLTPTIVPGTATIQGVSWGSSDNTKATVVDGVVTAIAVGTATITVTTDDGSKTANCSVTVNTGLIRMAAVITAPKTFNMGSPNGETGRNANETQHSVSLTKSFYMGTYTVTQGEYNGVMGNNPSYHNYQSTPYSQMRDQFPVENITWYDAVEFCNKLSEREGLKQVYEITGRTPATGYPITAATVTANWDNNGYRLPTEAEWECACRAGTTTAFNTYDNSISSWDVNYNPEGNYDDIWGDLVGYPMYAGWAYSSNNWSLYDMHGNVKEWCWDWLGDYGSAAATNPTGAGSGTNRIMRGGSYNSTYLLLRSAYRDSAVPSAQSRETGFRVVRNAQ